jgi:hypothetical protein
VKGVTGKAGLAAGVVLGALLASQGCNLDLFNFSFGLGGTCSDAGPPPNATGRDDGNGCTSYSCNEGFHQCEGTADCAIDLLGDANNCGVCGNVCPGGRCTEGSCWPVTVLLDGLSSTGEVAVDDTYVYAVSDGAILRVPKAGGTSVTMTSIGVSEQSPYSNQFNGVSIAADSSGLYWTSYGLNTMSAPGAQPTVLVASLGWANDPIVLGDQYVYWMTAVELTDAGGGAGASNVWRVAKTGGPPELVAALTTPAYYDDGNPIALGAGRLAWGDGTDVVAMALDGGSITRLAMQTPTIGSLAADDAFVYWVPGAATGNDYSWQFVCVAGDPSCGPSEGGSPEGGVFDVPWGGGPWRAISPTANVAHLVADAPYALYGVEAGGKAPSPVVQVDLLTGEHTVFAGGGVIGGLAIDATNLYWTRGTKLLASPLGR